MAELDDGLQIKVSTADLRQVSTQLSGDRAATLEPRSTQVKTDFSPGVPFGATSASGYVFAAKKRYALALDRAIATLAGYTARVDQIALATSEAADNYDEVDALTAVRLAGKGLHHSHTDPAYLPSGTVPAAPPPSKQLPIMGPPVPKKNTEEPAGGPVAPPWCTNWDAYNLHALWQMVEGDNIETGRRQVSTWAAVESALVDQIARLRRYRQTTEVAWPATSSPAARTFLAELDELIANMSRSETAAGRNKHALNGIMDSLESAKKRLEPLLGQYQGKADDMMLRQLDGAEDEINRKARQIMADAEIAVSQHTESITLPPRYSPSREDLALPLPPGGGGSGPGGDGGGSLVPPVPHHPPAPLPGINPVLPDGQQWTPGGGTPGGSGPILGGVGGGTTPPTTGLPSVGGGASIGAGAGVGIGGGLGSGSSFGGGALPPGGMYAPASGAGGRGVGGAQAGGRAGGTSSGMPGMAGMGAGGGRPGRNQSGQDSNGRADLVWEVAEGVAPVTEAPRGERRHDLGPGVIGINR
ncbi:hypothetical protein GCM10027280_16430 [Micromonospora polyrhachis]|uniref:PPE family protein n=1 Tax=Micromonospora polyrhachis TaxID=1282883 RepID=A0A7W7SPA9_9ACTN|nr:hypothetical protein [Micromonospora polyrhachis]MBB4958469.1 hypothetical protein [Micromonospora polyrhachis]